MAVGDITEITEYNLIEAINTWEIQYQVEYKKIEEQKTGMKKEIDRNVDYIVLVPFNSVKDNEGNWTHTATDISNENSAVQTKANATWTENIKNQYKTFVEQN